MSSTNKSESEWVGLKINNLTVLKKLGEKITKRGNYSIINDILLIVCSRCQVEREITAQSLIGNRPIGCRHCAIRIDAIGKRSGSLVVKSYEYTRSKTNRPILWYNCDCDCGGKHIVKADIFNIGDCTSCKLCRKSSKFIPSKVKNRTIHRYYNTILNNSKKRKICVDISQDEMLELLKQQEYKCVLSGLPIKIEDGTASLDRINNSVRIYNKQNAQWVHRTINFMKNELSQEDFLKYCSLVCHNYQPPSTQ